MQEIEAIVVQNLVPVRLCLEQQRFAVAFQQAQATGQSRQHRITAEFEVTGDKPCGVIVAAGGVAVIRCSSKMAF